MVTFVHREVFPNLEGTLIGQGEEFHIKNQGSFQDFQSSQS
jgi:hypothetical protein